MSDHHSHHERYWPLNSEAERLKKLIRSGRSPTVKLGLPPVDGHIDFDPDNPPDDKDPDRYTPWLFISATRNDQGDRPLSSPMGQVFFWKTPGIWVETYEQAGTPGQRVDSIQTGQSYQIAAQVNNAGYASSYGTIVEFYWVDSTDIAKPNVFNQIGPPIAITIPAGGSTVARSDLWVPTLVNGEIADLVVRSYDPVFDPIDPLSFSMVKDRHVGWKTLRDPR